MGWQDSIKIPDKYIALVLCTGDLMNTSFRKEMVSFCVVLTGFKKTCLILIIQVYWVYSKYVE